MSSFERRFGKYAIKNLPLCIIICYAIGYTFQLIAPQVFYFFYLNPDLIIHKLQLWRLVSWLLVPPSSLSFFTLIMLYFYYSIGRTLEATWGTYRFNVYIFSGILFTILGAFLFYAYTLTSQEMTMIWDLPTQPFARYFSTYYVNLSIFLAFAATFPDTQIYLFFVIPIRMKIMGIIYAILLGLEFVNSLMQRNYASATAMVASLLNFGIFFFTSRNRIRFSPQQIKRRHDFNASMRNARAQSTSGTESGRSILRSGPITRHKCAVCGRTDQTNPELQFRFCSKCNGNYEYCEDHLFTHQHVQ